MVSPDAANGKLEPGQVDKEISAVLLKLSKFVVGKSAVIMIRVLSAVINIDDFSWPQRHDWMQHHATDKRENCRVDANRQRQRQYRRGCESRRFAKLSQSELEILGHEELGFVSIEMQAGSVSDSTSL